MAKFVFKLQNIYELKLKLEDQAKAAFGAAVAKKNEEEAKLQELYELKEQYLEKRKAAAGGIINITTLKELENYSKAMDIKIDTQKGKLRRADQLLEIAREKLNESIKERKIYEKLRENAFEAFKQSVNEEEQKEINELVSFTYKERED